MIPWTTDISKDELRRNWHPIWISDLQHHVLMHVQMMRWCEKTCTSLWTVAWYQDYLAFWFKCNDDAVMFCMVWR